MHSLYLRPNGSVECLYSDDVQGLDLGVLSVSRASNVEFDNKRQEWVVLVEDQEIACSKSREEALAYEVTLLNQRYES
jgi:hypothetical protein